MNLPVNPPVLPMLAKRVDELPAGGAWIFEPKWDGFRALIFRDGDEIEIQSRDEKPLNRYFPELVEPLRAQLPARCVLDGEIVIAKDGGLDFDALQLRLHPAASRVKLLSKQMPASIVFFDLLCEGDRDLRTEPFQKRRHELEALLSSAAPPVHLTPATRESSVASDWFRRFEGAGLDGVMAKPIVGNLRAEQTRDAQGQTRARLRLRRRRIPLVQERRWHGRRLAAAGAFRRFRRVAACGRLRQFHGREAPRAGGIPCALSQECARQSSLEAVGRSMRQETAKPGSACPAARAAGAKARTCHGSRCARSWWSKSLTSTCRAARFRHMAHFRRWRTDKKPGDCTYAQLEVVPPQELAAIFAGGR